MQRAVFMLLALLVIMVVALLYFFGDEGGSVPAPVPAKPQCYVQYMPSEDRAHFADLGLSTYPFTFAIPPNTQIWIWLETYRDGKPMPYLTFSNRRATEKDKPLADGFRFSHYNPVYTTGEKAEKTRWILNFNNTTSSGRWLKNVFATAKPNEIHYSWRFPKNGPQILTLGKTVRLMDVTGRKRAADGTVSVPGQEAEAVMKQLAFCAMLKVKVERFDPASAGASYSGGEIPPEDEKETGAVF